MRIALGFLLAGLACAAPCAPVQVEQVRIWAAPDSTRVVFDVTSPVEHSIELITDPFRVVVDLKDALAPAQLAQPQSHDRFLRGVRSANHDGYLRVVLDLKKYSSAKSFQLTPNEKYGHRLVIDLFDAAQQTAHEEPPREETPPGTLREIVVAVDAGHGGEDPGAIGPKGTYEKDVVLAVARALVEQLNAAHGMRGVLIREGDYYLPHRRRMELARQHRADLFVSIHADAFRDARVKGSSVYVLSERGASSEHARWLAERENASDLVGGVSLDTRDDVLRSVLLDLSQTASLEASIDVAERVLGRLKGVGPLHKARVESAGFLVLKSPDIPSILVETAYISNPTEEQKLRSPAHQRKLAAAIVEGVRDYFVERPPEGTLLAARRHVITRGDTLSAIAEYYRVSVESLRELNGLQGDFIRVGQELTIPSASGG